MQNHIVQYKLLNSHLDIADLSLLSRRAWIQSAASARQLRKLIPRSPRMLNQIVKSSSAPQLISISNTSKRSIKKSSSVIILQSDSTTQSPKSNEPSSSSSTKSSSVVILQSNSKSKAKAVAIQSSKSNEPSSSSSTMHSIEEISEYAIKPVPESIKLKRYGLIPSQIARIDQELKQSLALATKKNKTITFPKHRPSARILKQHLNQQKRWNTLLLKNVRSSFSDQLETFQLQQRKWIVIVQGFVSSINGFQNVWLKILHERKCIRERNFAVAKLQNGWKKSYTKKMDAKHERTYELLRQRAWVARLNVRTRLRGRAAATVRSFLHLYKDRGRFSLTIKLFKWRVIRIQRAVRAFFQLRDARLKAITIVWMRNEKNVLIDLEVEKQILEKKEKQLLKMKRMSEAMPDIDMEVLMSKMHRQQPEAESEQIILPPKKIKSIPKPTNVKWERERRRQAKIQRDCDSFIDLLDVRENLISTDIKKKSYKNQTGRFQTMARHKNKNKKDTAKKLLLRPMAPGTFQKLKKMKFSN